MNLEVLFRMCKAAGPNVHKIAFIDRKKIQQFVTCVTDYAPG